MKVFGSLLGLSIALTMIASYITHLYWSVSSMFTNDLDGAGQVLLVIMGAIIPPLGMLHGLYLWFT